MIYVLCGKFVELLMTNNQISHQCFKEGEGVEGSEFICADNADAVRGKQNPDAIVEYIMVL